ncbi:FtsW/RodA/SpoVE family cell cycle protein [Fluviicola taffensis]|uniref:Probable peptidoglycan glycosyltransferase FtsW n=1 Tax=Fluviicola taffensis (strain DSM 16823 / NCIMB 13979 / RW262) TaxID=755732 RepID=F2IAP5_FLUTR|nr:FtsW/RodA/SpoVE family cell cycle protein [Fluviicola taffensis]AEA44200.1 cell cycle protein [Fluviicola taffensis DSM 16823]
MVQFLRKHFKGDLVIWVVTLILLGFSLVSVYSFVPILVKIEGGTPFKYLFKHFIYILLAVLAMYWVHKRDPMYISKMSKIIYYGSIALLIFTLFFGTKVNEAGRWVKIPFVGLTFQSSDFAKLALLIYVSRMLVKKKDEMNDWKKGFLPVMAPIVIICGLIVKDNFSTAAILFMICFMLLFLGRVPFSKLFSVIFAGILLFVMAIGLHKALPDLNILPRYETWVNRFTNRYENADDIDAPGNLQAKSAEQAIYSGGFLGQGIGKGKVKEFIPEAYADFFFASFVEEFGSFSAIILVLLYLIMLYRIMRIALRAEHLFETYVCLGIGILLLSQAAVNMMVCTGIFPVTGQNMPFLAMGGSAMIMACVAIGIVQGVAQKQEEKVSVESEPAFA